jgi:hypothetical protein
MQVHLPFTLPKTIGVAYPNSFILSGLSFAACNGVTVRMSDLNHCFKANRTAKLMAWANTLVIGANLSSK